MQLSARETKVYLATITQLLLDAKAITTSDFANLSEVEFPQYLLHELQKFQYSQKEKIDEEGFDLACADASIIKWGEKAQANQMTEECAELIVALNKFYNRDHNGTDAAGVITELADVEIMSACMRRVFGDRAIDAEKKRKLIRLAAERLYIPVPIKYLGV